MTQTAILATLGDWITEAEAAIARTVQGPDRPDILRSGFGALEDNIQWTARRRALIEARDLIAALDGGAD